MYNDINQSRRDFLTAAMVLAAAQLGWSDSSKAVTSKSFHALKQIDAGVLNMGSGSPNGHPLIPLHGWPYDIYTYADVAPLLASKGYRVIVASPTGSDLPQEAPEAFAEAIFEVDRY